MAVDTREKRQSALSLLVPCYPPGVDPSSIDQAERQASVWTYSGILSTDQVPVGSDFITPSGGDDAPLRAKVARAVQASIDKENEEKLLFNKEIKATLQETYDRLNGIQKVESFDTVKPFVKKIRKIPESQKIPAKLINWGALAKNRRATEYLLLEYYRFIDQEETAIMLIMSEL